MTLSLLAAAAHLVSCGLFCARNALLCLRNVEYSEGELAAIFQKWRSREVAFQTLLAQMQELRADNQALRTRIQAHS